MLSLPVQVIPTVQRCLSHPHSAVAGMAQHIIDRWRWQLAGHMHVLTCPTYMEDHLAAVEEEIGNGLVPLPQLPKHKQVVPLWSCKLCMRCHDASSSTKQPKSVVSGHIFLTSATANQYIISASQSCVLLLFCCRRFSTARCRSLQYRLASRHLRHLQSSATSSSNSSFLLVLLQL